MGINYLKLFPTPLSPETFGRLLRNCCPNIKFYKSIFTERTLAAGVRDQKIDDNENINRIYDYQELTPEAPLFPHSSVSINIIPSGNSEISYGNATSEIE